MARWPGPALLVAGAGFLFVEAVAAAAWDSPAYSYARNFISELEIGHPPYDLVMSVTFVLNGLLAGAAAIALVRRETPGALRSSLMALSAIYGLGMVTAGVFHGDTARTVHSIGAGMCIPAGNLLLFAAAWLLRRHGRSSAAVLAFGVGGLVGATGTVLMLTLTAPGHAGALERMAAYPNLLGQVALGFGLTVGRDRLPHNRDTQNHS